MCCKSSKEIISFRVFLIDFRSWNPNSWHCCSQWRFWLQSFLRWKNYSTTNIAYCSWTFDFLYCLFGMLWSIEGITKTFDDREFKNLYFNSWIFISLFYLKVCIFAGNYLHHWTCCWNCCNYIQKWFKRYFEYSTSEINDTTE